MKFKIVFTFGWILALLIILNPGSAFCELKSMDDAELSSVEAEGVTVYNVNNPRDIEENSGVLSVTAADGDPFDLNDPNSAENTLRLPAVNNNPIAAPQNEFYNSRPLPSCGSTRSCCP